MPFFIEIGRIQVRFICLLLRYDLQGCRIVTGVSFVNKERLNTLIGLQKCLRFQNEYNKVEIEHRVVKLWSEIKPGMIDKMSAIFKSKIESRFNLVKLLL